MFKIHTHQCPNYLTNSVHACSDDLARTRLRSATGTKYFVPHTRTHLATEPSLWLGQSCGTVYRQQFVTLTVYTLSSADSNRTFLICVLMIDFVMPFRSGLTHGGHKTATYYYYYYYKHACIYQFLSVCVYWWQSFTASFIACRRFVSQCCYCGWMCIKFVN